jgi:bifunctional UDP-N-acetylglucosamine pyrophosphorylase/glucosamine-1-phosphate N-acetyltransferase
MNSANKIKVLILAAGKGTRMKSEVPKVLTPFNGKTMIKHLLHSIVESGIDTRPTIIVGYKKDEVMKELGSDYDYAVQEEQLGTGHAVMSAEEILGNKTENIMVLPSDHPFVRAETLKKLTEKHLECGAKITMATVKLTDFEDWRSVFYQSFSRIVRDENGKIVKDVQFRDANNEEKKITEINPIFFCFEAKWLWQNLKTLKTDNDQNQYYLTDLIRIAIEEGEKIESIDIDAREALAANSKEELEILEKFA